MWWDRHVRDVDLQYPVGKPVNSKNSISIQNKNWKIIKQLQATASYANNEWMNEWNESICNQVRTRISFSLLRSTLLCMRFASIAEGTRSYWCWHSSCQPRFCNQRSKNRRRCTVYPCDYAPLLLLLLILLVNQFTFLAHRTEKELV